MQLQSSMYFVACVCPAELDEEIIVFKQWMKDRFGCVVALRAPAHITFVRPFWLEEERESEIQQALQTSPGVSSVINVELENFSHFSNRVIFINVKDNPLLTDLKRNTELHFANLFADNIKIEGRDFHPHVTVANRDLKPGDFEKAWTHFSAREFGATFYVNTISLLKLENRKWNMIDNKSV